MTSPVNTSLYEMFVQLSERAPIPGFPVMDEQEFAKRINRMNDTQRREFEHLLNTAHSGDDMPEIEIALAEARSGQMPDQEADIRQALAPFFELLS